MAPKALSPPVRRRAMAVACLAAGLLTLPPVLAGLGWGLFPLQADETILAWMGLRTLQGAVPYRDILTFIPPLIPAGIALWFKAAGASLASLRLLQALAAALLSGFLCAGLMQRGFGRGDLVPAPGQREAWAFPLASCLAALTFGWLSFPVWPVPSHHYAAAALALAALAVVGDPEGDSSRRCAFHAGFLGGLSGLALQTEGALVLAWLVLRPWGTRPWRIRAVVLMGASVPVVLAFGSLAALGAFGESWRCLVLQPLLYYRQSGGFNDVSLLEACRSWVSHRWQASPNALGGLYITGTGLVLATLPLAVAANLARAATLRDGVAALALARALALAGVALKGRSDVVHLAFFFPFALLSLAEGVRLLGARRSLRWLGPTWGVLLLLVGLSLWGGRWGTGLAPWPPDLRGADRWLTTRGPATVLKNLPGATPETPLVALPYGSFVYLAHAPIPPPVDWVYPSSRKSNAPWEYATLAAWMEAERPPFVLLNWGYQEDFLGDPSPLGEVLRARYSVGESTRWGLVLHLREPNDPRPRASEGSNPTFGNTGSGGY